MPPSLLERFPPPALMGVVNATPDSFSDGGRFLDPDAAVAQALRHVEDGAAIVDVGGESTRPGAVPVPLEDELARVLPVVTRIRARSDVPISVDTTKAEVATRALGAGATMVNDITALGGDPDMAAVVAESGCDLCLVHMQGTPGSMQDDPRYDDVVREVGAYLQGRVDAAVRAGIDRARICVDPGIGFGKTAAHNLQLLRAVPQLARRAGAPVLVGVSRKRFLGAVIGDREGDRTVATVVAGLEAVARGAFMLRVHDVRPHRDALRIREAILHGGPREGA